MNKVLQAAGRVIRTSDDVGIIALLDERFLQNSYIRLFPREWENYQEVGLTTIEKKVERFWEFSVYRLKTCFFIFVKFEIYIIKIIVNKICKPKACLLIGIYE